MTTTLKRRAKNITPGNRAEAQAVDLQKWLGLKDFTAVTRYCLMRVWTEEWTRRGEKEADRVDPRKKEHTMDKLATIREEQIDEETTVYVVRMGAQVMSSFDTKEEALQYIETDADADLEENEERFPRGRAGFGDPRPAFH
jgi:hypothetical protein